MRTKVGNGVAVGGGGEEGLKVSTAAASWSKGKRGRWWGSKIGG
jgi:hypothetical protein